MCEARDAAPHPVVGSTLRTVTAVQRATMVRRRDGPGARLQPAHTLKLFTQDT